MIKIKPHHYIDIIKLYGSGIDNFIPDKDYNHDFYKIANLLILNKETKISLTINDDDICKPCKYINSSGICTDSVKHLKFIESKDEWNKILDKRIIELMNFSTDKLYSSNEFCKILYENKEKIYEIWKEENDDLKEKRYILFSVGALKYLE